MRRVKLLSSLEVIGKLPIVHLLVVLQNLQELLVLSLHSYTPLLLLLSEHQLGLLFFLFYPIQQLGPFVLKPFAHVVHPFTSLCGLFFPEVQSFGLLCHYSTVTLQHGLQSFFSLGGFGELLNLIQPCFSYFVRSMNRRVSTKGSVLVKALESLLLFCISNKHKLASNS